MREARKNCRIRLILGHQPADDQPGVEDEELQPFCVLIRFFIVIQHNI